MSEIRTGRQKYYDIFAHFYDFFIKVHSGHRGEETRNFLVDSAQIENGHQVRILDICCGTGAVTLAFAKRYPDALVIGYDFSAGMLNIAQKKDVDRSTFFIQGDASKLPYTDACFDIVCCSHALYELKGRVRVEALMEMKRVVKQDGKVLIMEHEVPRNKAVKMMFYMRLLMMGAADAKEF